MKYLGTPASEGIAIGKVFRYFPYIPVIDPTPVSDEAVEAEGQRYRAAFEQVHGRIETIIEKRAGTEQAEIFQAHLDILEDDTLSDEILEAIGVNMNAAQAVDLVYTQYAEVLAAVQDELIAQRAADMMDLRLQLLCALEGKEGADLSQISEPVILVTHDLMPSDTGALDPDMILGIVTEIGGITSHSAIIARSHGIPALFDVENACEKLADGEIVILDARDGILQTEPTAEQFVAYTEKKQQLDQQREEERTYLDVAATTREGDRVSVLLNIGSADEDLDFASHVDGVGLFRTEFLYMGREDLPDEEEQYRLYKKVFEAFAPNPVTLRTLDIGGDKEVRALDLPKEENPFLGNRALRLCFEREEMFLTQLRAVLRASVHGNLKLMFPMVSGLEDLRRAKDLLEKAKEQLRQKGETWNPDLRVGTMIEIPALAVMADLLVKEVDFASIGTNDLTQYTLAVDRVNPAVSHYYQNFNPAVIRLLNYAVTTFRSAGKDISVCGEMGGDRIASVALLGMGIRSLSMGRSSVAAIKKIVCTLDMEQARRSVESACGFATAAEVKSTFQALL